MISLKNRWTLVTGASRGIGRLAAVELARRGSNLVLQARGEEQLQGVLREVTELGVEAYTVACELSDEKQIRSMLAEIERRGTRIDAVLNNAGVQVTYRTNYYETPAEDFVRSTMINVAAPMLICYALLPGMIERGFGRIVNVTSGIDKEPEQAAYSASKAGLDKVTRDIGTRLEGTDVTISLADPGWCRTDLGGPNAPNSPESSTTGIIMGLFVDDKHSGRTFHAQEFSAMTLEEAVAKVQGEA